jgi:D-3-phosphoglycerate dehydrogenase
MSKEFLVILVDKDLETSNLAEETKELAKVGGEIKAVKCFTEEDVIHAAAYADIITTDMMKITGHVFESLPNLKAVIRRGIGYDVIDVKAATDKGVIVINIPSFCAEEVSNHVLMFLLNIAKKTMQLCTLTKAGKWSHALEVMKPMASIHGETLGLIGCGRLGQLVAKKAKAFGMRVIAYDAYLPQNVFTEIGVEDVSFDQLLQESDYVSLHVTLTDETRHMMNESAFRRMKPTAALINTARGAVVDEKALIAALEQGQIAAAGLDVFEREPIDADNPLLAMGNVLVMPHTAYYSDTAFTVLGRTAGQEEVRIAQGFMPMGVVNKNVVPRVPLKPCQD